METIGNYAFESCRSLICIYFYGETSPTFSSSAFYRVPAASAIKLEMFQGKAFGDLEFSTGTKIDECLPPTLTFTESNTFTASLPSGASFTNTFTLTHTLSLTQSMSVCNSMLSFSFSLYFVRSRSTYIPTELIYYSYTAVAYSFYCSYYISTFTVYYPSEASVSGSNTIIIAAACAVAAAAAVVALLVVILIKIRSKKQASGEKDTDNFERDNFEATNTFSGGLSFDQI